MGILIKGMEMPKSCLECPLLDNFMCKCKLHDKEYRSWNEEYDHCPLTELPPHGRLIIEGDEIIAES